MKGAAMTYYIGLDAHSTTCTFVAMNRGGKKLSTIEIPTNEYHLGQYLKSLKGPKILTFEESNLSRWLYVTLKPMVNELIVCAPQYLLRKRGAKTDLRDASHLANELRLGSLIPVYHDECNYLIELRTMVKCYQNVVDETVRCKNRLKSIFRSQVISCKGTHIYNSPESIDLLESSCDKFNADVLFYQLGTLEEIKQRYLDFFHANTLKHKKLKQLTTIPGISAVRAHVIAAITCDANRFKNKHHYWSYSMLVRHIQKSAKGVYGKVSSYGRSELKNTFMGAAIAQLRGTSEFRKYYDRLRTKGVGDRQAKKALARKTAAIALSIMRTDKKYNDNWEVFEKKQVKA